MSSISESALRSRIEELEREVQSKKQQNRILRAQNARLARKAAQITREGKELDALLEMCGISTDCIDDVSSDSELFGEEQQEPHERTSRRFFDQIPLDLMPSIFIFSEGMQDVTNIALTCRNFLKQIQNTASILDFVVFRLGACSPGVSLDDLVVSLDDHVPEQACVISLIDDDMASAYSDQYQARRFFELFEKPIRKSEVQLLIPYNDNSHHALLACAQVLPWFSDLSLHMPSVPAPEQSLLSTLDFAGCIRLEIRNNLRSWQKCFSLKQFANCEEIDLRTSPRLEPSDLDGIRHLINRVTMVQEDDKGYRVSVRDEEVQWFTQALATLDRLEDFVVKGRCHLTSFIIPAVPTLTLSEYMPDRFHSRRQWDFSLAKNSLRHVKIQFCGEALPLEYNPLERFCCELNQLESIELLIDMCDAGPNPAKWEDPFRHINFSSSFFWGPVPMLRRNKTLQDVTVLFCGPAKRVIGDKKFTAFADDCFSDFVRLPIFKGIMVGFGVMWF